jgi:hypothetical protein
MRRRLASAALAAAITIPAIGSCREAAPKDQGHEHSAPHGGTLVELGAEFAHVELVLDRVSGTLTAFVLDGEAERPIRIAQPLLRLRLASPETRTLDLAGRTNPLTGERSGDTSEFTVTDPLLRTSTAVSGVIVELAVRGTRFTDVPFTLAP